MGQDWKTLGVVVIGAALAGWLVVRMLTGGPAAPPAPAETERATTAAPPPAVAPDEAGATPVRRAAPPKPAAVEEPAPAAENDESATIVRDLTTLAQALQRDVRIEDRVMPRVNDALDVPGPIEYRRAPDFWQPALAGGAERTR